MAFISVAVACLVLGLGRDEEEIHDDVVERRNVKWTEKMSKF